MELESVAEDIPKADDIYNQLFDDPRDIYSDKNAAELTNIQTQDLLQYHCPGPCNIDTAGLFAVQAHPVYYRQFPRLCPRDNGGHTTDFEPGIAVQIDSDNSVVYTVQQSYAKYCRIEFFAGLADPIAGGRIYIAAEADAG